MLPYWLLFTLFAAGAVQYGRRPTPGVQAAPFLAVAAILIVIIVGLRFQVGADWEAYVEMFDGARYLEFDDTMLRNDPGYLLINQIVYWIGLEVWAVNVLCALVFTFGLVKFSRRQPNPWLAVLVAVPYLIIVVAMGYSRQAVAIGLIMAGLTAVEKQSFVRFGMYIVVAATFHKTAVIILPLVALTAARHRAVIGAAVAVTGYFLYSWFLEAGMEKFSTNYLEEGLNSQGAAIRVVMNIVPAIIFLLYQKRFQLIEPQRQLWRNFSIAAVLMLALLFVLPSSTAVDRLALYIIPLQLFVLSRAPDAFPNRDGTRNTQLVLLVILYSALIQFVWLNFANHAEYWLPYQFYPLLGE